MVWREITEEGLWGGKMAEQSFMEGQALTTILVNSWVDMSRVWILPSSPPARLWMRMTSILPFNRDDLMGTWMALVPDRSSHRWPRQGHLDGNIIAFTTLLGEVLKGTFIHFMKGFFFFLHVGIRMLGSYEQSRFMHWWKNQLPLPFSSKTLCVCVCVCSVSLSCPTLCHSMDCSPPASLVHGILQTRILEWVAISYSRRSSPPRDWTHISCVSCTGGRILYHWTIWQC